MSFPLVIGLDVSTARLALADVSGKTATLMLSKDRDGEALQDTYHRAGIFARQFVDGRPVVCGFYEIPMGKHPSPFLMQTVGVAAAGMFNGLRGEQAHPVSMWPINISTWKKRSVGHGNAGKAQILRWAQGLGFEDDCPKCHAEGTSCDALNAVHDKADALGIAFGGWDWLSSKALAA